MRVALAFAVALLLAIAAAAWLLPRWFAGDAFREILRAAAQDATGRDVAWDDLSFGLFPPRLVATQLRVGDAAAPLALAERVDLRIAVAPLLERQVRVDSLALDGVAWRFERGPAVVDVPIAGNPPPSEPRPAAVAPPSASTQSAPAVPAAGRGPSLRFAVRSVELHRSRIVWDDRAAQPPVAIELRDVEGLATRSSEAAPMTGSVAGTLASGGTLRIAGSVALDGNLDIEATLGAVDLAPFAGYFGRDFALAGRIDGTIRARGPAVAFEVLEADLEIADASVRAGDVATQGPVALKARLHGSVTKPEGDFELDATRAQLSAYGGAFNKPPGAPATASGKLVRDAKGKLSVESVRLSIKNMNGQTSAAPDGVHFDAAPFDLSGWGELIPALARLSPEGPIAFEGVRVATSPLALGGRVRLDGVRLHTASRAPIALRGALLGNGASIASEGLVATLGGQAVALSLHIDGLDAVPSHHSQLHTKNADASALLEALTGKADVLEGAATIDADLAGPLGAAAPAGVAGSIDLAVGAGRIANVSPLRAAVDGLARYSESAKLIDRESAERSLAPYLGDRFESIRGHFALGDGYARTEALVLRYPGYQLEVRGSVALEGQRLDLSGRIALDEAVFAALAEKPAEEGAGARIIDVARVHGTAAEPKLEVDRAGALAFAASFALAQRRDKLERKLDEQLGEGSGGAILDALDRVLGKKQKR
jgi:uncharacterized protein involved in outer membrane biogenesis